MRVGATTMALISFRNDDEEKRNIYVYISTGNHKKPLYQKRRKNYL